MLKIDFDKLFQKSKIDVIENWSRISGQVTGYFTSAITLDLNRRFERETLIPLILTITAAYIISETFLRWAVMNFEKKLVKATPLWLNIIDEWFNVAYRFFIFIFIQYINTGIADVNSSMTQNDILIQLLIFFIVSFVLVTVVSVLEYIYSKFSKNKTRNYYDISNFHIFGLMNFLKAWEGIYGVVIQFFSTNLFQIISLIPNQTVVTISSILFFVAYLTLEGLIRTTLTFKIFKPKSKLWKQILDKFLDFYYVISIFFIVNWLGSLVDFSSERNMYSTTVQIVVLFILFIILFSVLAIISYISKGTDKNNIYLISDTTERIWPKISGTVTGLIATIFSNRIIDGDNDFIVLLSIIILLLIYIIMLPVIKKTFEYIDPMVKNNELWKSVMTQIYDFFTSLGFLLIFSSISDIVSGDNGRGLEEKIIYLLIIQMVLSFVFVLLEYI